MNEAETQRDLLLDAITQFLRDDAGVLSADVERLSGPSALFHLHEYGKYVRETFREGKA